MRTDGTLFDSALSAGNNGSLTSQVTVTAAYTMTGDEQLIRVDCTGGAVTVTLPLAAGRTGYEYVFKKIETSANAVTLARAGTDTIDGATSATIAGGSRGVTRLRSNGTTWDIL